MNWLSSFRYSSAARVSSLSTVISRSALTRTAPNAANTGASQKVPSGVGDSGAPNPNPAACSFRAATRKES